MGRLKVDNWAGKAMASIQDRARKDPRYVAAIEATFNELNARQFDTIEQLRAVGGWSVAIEKTFERLVGDATIPGSELMGPMPLKSAFYCSNDRAELRLRLQTASAARVKDT